MYETILPYRPDLRLLQHPPIIDTHEGTYYEGRRKELVPSGGEVNPEAVGHNAQYYLNTIPPHNALD